MEVEILYPYDSSNVKFTVFMLIEYKLKIISILDFLVRSSVAIILKYIMLRLHFISINVVIVK